MPAALIGGKKKPVLTIMAVGLTRKPGDKTLPSAGDKPAAAPAVSSDDDNQPDNGSDDDYGGKGPGGKTIQPGEANFRDQTKTCSTCDAFDPAGNNGVGQCKMNVPEADFSKSDPDSSYCDYWVAPDDATQAPPTPGGPQNEDDSSSAGTNS